MYTIASLIFVTLLWPLTWVVVLLLIALFSKNPKRKKRSLIAAVIILFVFSNRFILSLFAHAWDVAPGPLPKGKVYSAAIILGGFTNEDFTRHGFFTDHSDRLIEAMYLKSSGRVSHIMMSGGNSDPGGDGFTEAGWVKKTLLDMHYPDTAILIDKNSKNTYENATFTRKVLDNARLKPPYLLVTSAFHMRRALYIFRKHGVDVLPYPCDYVAGNTNTATPDYLIPNLYALSTWNFYIKELFGMMVAHMQR